ncbi:hypothetical protein JWJ90_13505 [Desulfobulbus rhabdoformis]|uniref:hypothetical protein n=1 Tax=Desulfobulbus rhabdoformis TaxID=34032 RepID=UPI001965BCA6|nr:hypothetical protein [Desulfobulbus rhabdoformis]MBM9615295.1 hypothetical protein [Desulfobulbus rhabdoformis]
MKFKTAMVATLALFIPWQANASEQGLMKFCSGVDLYARKHMEWRQEGVPMSMMMSTLKATNPRLRKIAADAYEEPAVIGHDLQERIITEYGNRWYKECLKDWRSFLP